jgi:two-component system, NtrC family, response regulator AtoC
MNNLLLIDDDPGQLIPQLRLALTAGEHHIDVARTGAAGVGHVRAARPDVVLLNLCLPDQSGLDVYKQLKSIDGRIPVIFVTGNLEAQAAIEAMKRGAYDCLFKPPDLAHLGRVIGEALEISRARTAGAETGLGNQESGVRSHQSGRLTPDPCPLTPETGQLIGTSPAMRQVYKAIGMVAAQDLPVLITGESGTGKELVARAIHQHSNRAERAFQALNAAAIPETLLESELFGHEKGAFTGASGKRIGKFEQCHGGTLFLDEIGDMPLASQAKILRVLQEQAFEPVGSNETIRTDARLLAATHRDLGAWSAEGKFRPDLYYRLSVFPIHLPPLRERVEDLPALVQHYLHRFSRELGREVREMAPEALECLHGYSWPGNIRELQSVLKQALLRASGTVLLPAFLPDFLARSARSSYVVLSGSQTVSRSRTPNWEQDGAWERGLESFIRERLMAGTRDLYAEAQRHVDRILLPRVLEYTDGNKRAAAHTLGIARQTLRLKCRELELSDTASSTLRRSRSFRSLTSLDDLPNCSSTCVPTGHSPQSVVAGDWTTTYASAMPD